MVGQWEPDESRGSCPVLRGTGAEMPRSTHRNIYVASERAGDRVMKGITHFLAKKLRLKVNAEKSAVGRPWERKFLVFTFTWQKQPRRRIAPQALARVKAKIRQMTIRERGDT